MRLSVEFTQLPHGGRNRLHSFCTLDAQLRVYNPGPFKQDTSARKADVDGRIELQVIQGFQVRRLDPTIRRRLYVHADQPRNAEAIGVESHVVCGHYSLTKKNAHLILAFIKKTGSCL